MPLQSINLYGLTVVVITPLWHGGEKPGPAVCDGDGLWPASAQSSLCWQLFPDLYGLQKGWTESDPFPTRRIQCMIVCIRTWRHVNILSSGLIGHASLPSNVSSMSDGGRQPPRITLMCTQGWGLRPRNYTIQIIQSASLAIVAQIKQISFGGNNNEVVLQIRIIGWKGGAIKQISGVMKWWKHDQICYQSLAVLQCWCLEL